MPKINCKNCKKEIDEDEFKISLNVCSSCGFHDYMSAGERIRAVVDEGSFKELASGINSVDFLDFQDLRPYSERLKGARSKSEINEAIEISQAKINDRPASLGVMDFSFMGGSMGSVVGEKVRILTDNSIARNIPLIIFSTSGGARMQEGILSLMQMAKTVSGINRLREARIPFFCIITNPTTGGVSASFVTVADIILSEPGALFCFAGPRVVEQTIKKAVPKDFGLAERNLINGQIDMIVERKDIRDILGRLLSLFT